MKMENKGKCQYVTYRILQIKLVIADCRQLLLIDCKPIGEQEASLILDVKQNYNEGVLNCNFSHK